MKPKLHGLIGWSWLVLGALGILTGVISLISIPAMSNPNLWLNQPGMEALQPYADSMRRMAAWALPSAIAQLVFSGLMTYAAWLFLQGRNRGRLLLSGLNALLMVATLWAAGAFAAAMDRLIGNAGPEVLSEFGFSPSFPSLLQSAIWGSAVLIVLPAIWMAWWFHSAAVRRHFGVD